MTTMGQLYDALNYIREAEKQVAECQRSLENGGAPDTIIRKQDSLQHAKEWLNCLRNEPLIDEEE